MSSQKTHADQKYIDGLKQDNSFVIREIYDKFAPKVIHFICQKIMVMMQKQKMSFKKFSSLFMTKLATKI